MNLAKQRRTERVGVAVLLALCVAVFSTLATRWVWVNDDAFITFRYAEHCAAGHGFVWNTDDGRPVEGSTSLAWTGLNAIFVRAGGDPLTWSHRAGWLAGALALVLAVYGATAVLGLRPWWALVAAAFLALQRQWITWSVSGMETSAAALVTLGATLLLLRETRRAGGRGYASGALFLLATLLRPETPLLHGAALVGVALGTPGGRPWRALLQSGLVHALGLAGLTLWRLAYFGQALPNTFYVKAGSPQLGRGLEYLAQFVAQNDAWLWAVPIMLAAPLAWRHARAATAALLLQVVAWSVWVVALGGGRWEFRFFVPVLPACALLLASSMSLLARQGDASRRRVRRTLAALAAAALLATQCFVLRAPFRPFDDVLSREQLLQSVQYMTLEASLLARYLTSRQRVCTGWAGAFPFYTAAWHYDPWGLNEPTIARRPRNTKAVVFHQRHAEWDDLVENRVQFVDLFNHFLFRQPFDPARPRNVTPWTRAGVPVYSVRLPEGQYWLFSSTWPRDELEAWLSGRGLQLVSVLPLPAGWPTLGV